MFLELQIEIEGWAADACFYRHNRWYASSIVEEEERRNLFATNNNNIKQ